MLNTILTYLATVLGGAAVTVGLSYMAAYLLRTSMVQSILARMFNLGLVAGQATRSLLLTSKIKLLTKWVILLIVVLIEWLNRYKEGLLSGANKETLAIVDALIGTYQKGGNKLAVITYTAKKAKHSPEAKEAFKQLQTITDSVDGMLKGSK